MKKPYPQAERDAWAAAYADKCSAIWRLVDARTARAMAKMSVRDPARDQALDNQIAVAEADRDIAIARCRAARQALDEAEAEAET